MSEFTLHTDESGSFEGDAPRGTRLVAGLLMPAMPKKSVICMRRAYKGIAKEIFGEGSLSRLHARDLRRWPTKERDRLTRRLLGTLHDILPVGQRPHLVLMLHRGDHDPVAHDNDPLASPAFAANRYQRLLVELVHQVLQNVPGPEQQDRVALHLASRVFPVDPSRLEALSELGYRHIKDRKDREGRPLITSGGQALVHIGDKASVRAALQTLMGSRPRVRASAASLNFTSIKGSDDPRFALIDSLANYLFRRPHIFGDANWKHSAGLPKLDMTALCFGPALDVLTLAHDALACGDVVRALQVLEGVDQPPVHEPALKAILKRLTTAAGPALKKHPRVASRLIARAEHVLDHREYGLLTEAERIARVVLRAKDISIEHRRRANTILGTAANHRGTYREAADALDQAIEATETTAPSIGGLLARVDLENRRAVTEMNVFRFDIGDRLDPYLKLLEALTKKYLGEDARESIAGEVAGTLAQAACHRHDWRRAQRYFRVATQHLGEDHMQASYRAHAAIERGKRDDARQAVIEALGSSYARRGYDLDRGQRRLDAPLRTMEEAITGAPFDAWLVLKLVERGWIGERDELAEPIAQLVKRHPATHHPNLLIRICAGRTAEAAGLKTQAIETWSDAYQRSKKDARTPTVGAIRLQAAAHLVRVGAPAHRTRSTSTPWVDALLADGEALVKRHAELGDFLGENLREIRNVRNTRRRLASAVEQLLSSFTFIYH